jgi:hypothetical protein
VHDLTVGAAAGGIAMGALGCLVGLASLAIPGLGLFIVAGPLAAVLGDVAVAGALGAVAGGLIGLRVPEHRAKAYEVPAVLSSRSMQRPQMYCVTLGRS